MITFAQVSTMNRLIYFVAETREWWYMNITNLQNILMILNIIIYLLVHHGENFYSAGTLWGCGYVGAAGCPLLG